MITWTLTTWSTDRTLHTQSGTAINRAAAADAMIAAGRRRINQAACTLQLTFSFDGEPVATLGTGNVASGRVDRAGAIEALDRISPNLRSPAIDIVDW